ncbi:hypothetical protein [Williamsia sp. DF01-3]|uniref:hypothetical protein n=1 Tax=Williamsia sp. DF01-3 TaxID=2934157 RepID=UPI001FF56278|nr:hypothetical protein [Williamsia sp. DF01-3]MCK0517909.1 hypothetical protein [Williamsia sp. DF01-3]
MSDTETKPLTMSVEEAAALIPCSVEHYKRRLAAGIWPGAKPSREWRVTPAQVQQAIDISSTKTHGLEQPRASGLSLKSRTIKRKST